MAREAAEWSIEQYKHRVHSWEAPAPLEQGLGARGGWGEESSARRPLFARRQKSETWEGGVEWRVVGRVGRLEPPSSFSVSSARRVAR
jgi:hypothetical protein